MRPFSYSVFVYKFWRASTSDGVQYSGLETLRCTPADVLTLPKMKTKTLWKRSIQQFFRVSFCSDKNRKEWHKSPGIEMWE